MSVLIAEPQILTSIIDNQDGNTLHNALELITDNGRELWIATAFFSLDALNMLGENLLRADKIRLLFGDEASARQRNALINASTRSARGTPMEQPPIDFSPVNILISTDVLSEAGTAVQRVPHAERDRRLGLLDGHARLNSDLSD